MTGQSRKSADVEPVLRTLSRSPQPAAPAEFRDRLRAQFVGDVIPVPLKSPGRRGAPAHWERPAVAALGIAAALAVAVMLRPGPALRLVSASGTGVVAIDGHSTALDRTAEIARRLRPGAELRMPPEGQLDLEIPGIAAFQITGGSRVILPGRPGRWSARALRVSLEEGEVRVATGPRFRGTRLQVLTPETRAIVTGTTFAVIRNRDASCVCVLDGRVAMVGEASTDTVRSGFRRSVFRDHRPPLLEPILPMETMKLTMLRDQANRGAVPVTTAPR